MIKRLKAFLEVIMICVIVFVIACLFCVVAPFAVLVWPEIMDDEVGL